MNWQDYVTALLATGLTQKQIALAIGRGQTTVSDLYLGRTTDPQFSVGYSLLALGRRLGVKGRPKVSLCMPGAHRLVRPRMKFGFAPQEAEAA